ncbi:TetR/AcrR family transcriptional regulator [Halieaceae bacterium IMCC14734]|uniref:TetR/AcrR family transcriptional regulator n=1 Tax=Candidatus Litorirhabdus singularis TaxID=2518993 RepID=A0ABT3THQ1_9GAMM|nr:TetR/AcrR family transcriptional regulator [Candidatus Litorirhabdus singularis]MCX2981529.1 TetR/AcrR family transcriptional regulator [Candidatus Litorirhabdus singularis]
MVAEAARSSEQTRALLVSAATQLFAERGLDGVSLAEINRAAGQRNATALHYHFGGREGLLQAIFDKHRPRVELHRGQLLSSLGAEPRMEELARVLILPLLEQVGDSDGGVDYLQFLAQLMNHSQLGARGLDREDSPLLNRQQQLFAIALTHLSPAVRELRLGFAVLMAFNSLGAYAAKVRIEGFDAAYHQLVAEQLVAAFAAVLDFSG